GLELSADWKESLDRLVTEAHLVFGVRHYDSYHFLLSLSDQIQHLGLEHRRSSDNRLPERTLLNPDLRKWYAGLLPHELIHSWNGKYRLPSEMLRTDYQEPQRTKLLWVYEGLTHYLTLVLVVRSGFWTLEEARDYLATTAETLQNQ